LHHQVFGGDGLVLKETGAQLLVVNERHKLPLRQRFGHGELEFDHTVLIRDQLREEEGRFVQVFSRRDLAEIRTWRRGRGAGCSIAASLGFGGSEGSDIGLFSGSYAWGGGGRSVHRHRRHSVRHSSQFHRTSLLEELVSQKFAIKSCGNMR